MIEPAQLLLICALGTAAAIAGLLGVPPSRRASDGLRRRVLGVIPLVSGILRGSRSHGGGEDELRGSAEVLLHQYAALLQSGRSQAQAWADLSSHWRSRDTEHPLTQVCVLAAAAEQAGLGAVVGLRRSLESLSIPGSPALGRRLWTAAATVHSRVLGSGASPGAQGVLAEVLESLISSHALSQSTGAPLARLCRKAADSMEDSAALEAAVRAAAAGPRLTQGILAALPVGGVVLGALMGAAPLAVLFGSVLGWGCLLLGLGCMLLGWHWSSAMIRSVARHG